MQQHKKVHWNSQEQRAVHAMAALPRLLALVPLMAESHAIEFHGAGWLAQQRIMLERARSLQPTPVATSSTAAKNDGVVPWPRLLRELRTAQQLSLVLPASSLSLALTATELLAPKLRGACFDAVLQPGATFELIRPKLTLLALLALIAWLLNISSSILFAQARWTTAMAARVRLMASVLEQEPAFFDAQPPGELNSRLLSEPERLESLANRGPERALNALLSVGGGAALMFALDWRLALVAVALRAPLIGQLAAIAGRTVGLLNVLQQRTLDQANALATEALAQPHAVAVHAARGSILDSYARRVEEYIDVIRATLLAETTLRFTRLGVDSLTSLALLGFGLRRVLDCSISLGALFAFYAYADRFADGCQKLQELLYDLVTIRPACQRYFELIDRQSRMAHTGGERPASCEGELELVDASISFPGCDADAALRHVSITVRAGETLAVVGPSGAGKSTLLKLLARLYDPSDGAVRLDGRDVRALNLEWFRRQTGYVAQQPSLFDFSVADNVRFGAAAGALPADADVQAALEAVGAADFVSRLPHGLATRLGEGGRRLSGGQRQRIACARALVHYPRILLWDEATSALDDGSERQVHAALRAAATGRKCTAVLVTHRLSSVLCADRVAVLRDGRLEAVGTPAELAGRPGWFRDNFYPGGETP
jgi:ATP-binding cassette subfamily B protein